MNLLATGVMSDNDSESTRPSSEADLARTSPLDQPAADREATVHVNPAAQVFAAQGSISLQLSRRMHVNLPLSSSSSPTRPDITYPTSHPRSPSATASIPLNDAPSRQYADTRSSSVTLPSHPPPLFVQSTPSEGRSSVQTATSAMQMLAQRWAQLCSSERQREAPSSLGGTASSSEPSLSGTRTELDLANGRSWSVGDAIVPLQQREQPPPLAPRLSSSSFLSGSLSENSAWLQDLMTSHAKTHLKALQSAATLQAENEELLVRDDIYKQRVAKLKQDLKRQKGISQELRVQNKVGQRGWKHCGCD